MKTELHEELLKMAKSFLHDLSNEDFLGLTCDRKFGGFLVRMRIRACRSYYKYLSFFAIFY